MILADKIIDLRKKNGWSQEELAEQLGVSRQSVSKWESGMSVPDLNKIIAMSELFGVSTDYLLTGKAVTAADERGARQALLQALAHAETREHQPFSRQELAAMFAALLLET